MTPPLALLGAGSLWLMYAWLLSAIAASYLSHRKGYGERPGLASGMLLLVLGVVIWLFVPAKPGSLWREVGPFRRARSQRPARSAGSAPPSADTSERT